MCRSLSLIFSSLITAQQSHHNPNPLAPYTHPLTNLPYVFRFNRRSLCAIRWCESLMVCWKDSPSWSTSRYAVCAHAELDGSLHPHRTPPFPRPFLLVLSPSVVRAHTFARSSVTCLIILANELHLTFDYVLQSCLSSCIIPFAEHLIPPPPSLPSPFPDSALSRVDSSWLVATPKLRILDVFGNANISQLPRDLFNNTFPAATNIDDLQIGLTGCRAWLLECADNCFDPPPKLDSLDIASLGLTELPEEFLCNYMREAKQLVLTGNPITRFTADSFRCLTKVKKLIYGLSSLEQIDPGSFDVSWHCFF